MDWREVIRTAGHPAGQSPAWENFVLHGWLEKSDSWAEVTSTNSVIKVMRESKQWTVDIQLFSRCVLTCSSLLMRTPCVLQLNYQALPKPICWKTILSIINHRVFCAISSKPFCEGSTTKRPPSLSSIGIPA